MRSNTYGNLCRLTNQWVKDKGFHFQCESKFWISSANKFAGAKGKYSHIPNWIDYRRVVIACQFLNTNCFEYQNGNYEFLVLLLTQLKWSLEILVTPWLVFEYRAGVLSRAKQTMLEIKHFLAFGFMRFEPVPIWMENLTLFTGLLPRWIRQ